MSWVKLDDQIMTHPKMLRAGRDARDLFIAGLCYCASHLTDGVIPLGALRVLGGMADIDDPAAAAQRLTDETLWTLTEDSYQVHDYLAYNPTASEVKAVKAVAEQRKAEGRAKGYEQVLHGAGGKFQPKAPLTTALSGDSEPHQADSQNRSPSPSPSPSPISPSNITDDGNSTVRESAAPSAADAAPSRSLTAATPVPSVPVSPDPPKPPRPPAGIHPPSHASEQRPAPTHQAPPTAPTAPTAPTPQQPPGAQGRPPPSGAPNDVLWDALTLAVGNVPQTKSERGAWNTAMRELRDARASPEQVAQRAANYRAAYGPDIRLTPTALVKHWGEMEHPHVRATNDRPPRAAQPSSPGSGYGAHRSGGSEALPTHEQYAAYKRELERQRAAHTA